MKKLVKNGMLCTESGVYEADLLIEDGVIREIGTGLSDAEAEVVEAKGKYVLPGAVDIHTHMDLDVGIARVIDDFYTGTIAAACGGTTSIVDHIDVYKRQVSGRDPQLQLRLSGRRKLRGCLQAARAHHQREGGR